MKLYLTTTFSPAMLTPRVKATVQEITEPEFRLVLMKSGRTPLAAIGHENTALLIGAKFSECFDSGNGWEIFEPSRLFKRIGVSLEEGDMLTCAVPQFRVGEAREFTDAEIEAASFRFFLILVEVE